MFIPGKPLHNETQRHVARMSVRNSDHIEDLDLLIRALVSTGLWPLLTSICVAGPDASDSLLDLKGYQDSALVGSPPFVADQGFTTVGVNTVISTQITLSASSQAAFSASVYIRSASVGGNTCFMGELYEDDASSKWPLHLLDAAAGSFNAWLRSYVGGYPARTVSGGGFRAACIAAIDAMIVVGDEGAVTSSVFMVPWGAPGTHYPLHVGCRNGANGRELASANQYAHWSIGSIVSQTDLLLFDTIIKDYFTRRGTAV